MAEKNLKNTFYPAQVQRYFQRPEDLAKFEFIDLTLSNTFNNPYDMCHYRSNCSNPQPP